MCRNRKHINEKDTIAMNLFYLRQRFYQSVQEFSYIRYSVGQFVTKADYACVRGSPMVGNSFTICTNFITNRTIGKEVGANGKNGNAISTNGTDVTN